MFACETYLKDRTDFGVFIIWALVRSSGCFEQCGRIEASLCMQRDDEGVTSRSMSMPVRVVLHRQLKIRPVCRSTAYELHSQ